jgi:plastocyanin
VRRIALAVAAFAVAAVAAGGAGAATKGKTLVGTVADPLQISLTLGGKKVTSLKAGRYTIVVKDTASDHNFHLTGPGVDKSTSVGAKQVVRWTVRLKKGTYTYVCDPHASFMKGSFTVR